MTDKKLGNLELMAWANDNFKKFKRELKNSNISIDKESIVEEYIRGKFKPTYKRLDLFEGKKFVGCIFAPLTFKRGEI